ncbi:hypothetical protein BKG77_06900 [Mycobacteroides chelonae]|uniref:hypothetical protein n=1 Tax=Mycobacteroides chelonae TaxID=1774 RepID=UPI0008A8E90A|nr:hypothetical protein [Mycobacteroides chelonae]OHU23388.1 hypothetical protein BKG77_06900 [Mycobacteroides chelonae]
MAQTFPAKTVKQSPDGAVAVRRNTSADDAAAWGVMTLANGGHYASTAEVEDWPVLGAPSE